MEANLEQIQNLQTTEEDLKSSRHGFSQTAFVGHTALCKESICFVFGTSSAADGMLMSDWDVHVNYSRKMSAFQPYVIHLTGPLLFKGW